MKSLLPVWNNFVFFDVNAVSFHQVKVNRSTCMHCTNYVGVNRFTCIHDTNGVPHTKTYLHIVKSSISALCLTNSHNFLIDDHLCVWSYLHVGFRGALSNQDQAVGEWLVPWSTCYKARTPFQGNKTTDISTHFNGSKLCTAYNTCRMPVINTVD